MNPGLLFEAVGDLDHPADPETGHGSVAYLYEIRDGLLAGRPGPSNGALLTP